MSESIKNPKIDSTVSVIDSERKVIGMDLASSEDVCMVSMPYSEFSSMKIRIEELEAKVKRLTSRGIEDMRNEIEQLRAKNQWQPIETAPKDGTQVLLWWPYWCVDTPIVGSYNFDHDEWDSMSAISIVDSPPPTKWMPLPEPPKGTER
jgi:hypothetical protein